MQSSKRRRTKITTISQGKRQQKRKKAKPHSRTQNQSKVKHDSKGIRRIQSPIAVSRNAKRAKVPKETNRKKAFTDSKSSVSGYWRGKKYVKSYTRQKPISRNAKAKKEARKLKRILPRLKPGWKRYIEVSPVGRIVYTFKIEAVVDMRGNYAMSFTTKGFESRLGRNAATVQFYHTKFTPTIQEAVIDLREKHAIMQAYGGVNYLSVDLYKVSGDGPLREKHWTLLGEYDEPDDVPGF